MARVDAQAQTRCASGTSGRLSAQIGMAFSTLGRVARALTGTGTLSELLEHALAEIRSALELDAAALYVPAADGSPVLRRQPSCRPPGAETELRDELVFDEDAWRWPAVGRSSSASRRAGWSTTSFLPAASNRLRQVTTGDGRLAGVVPGACFAAARARPRDDRALALLGDQLAIGIAAARLREQVHQVEIERESGSGSPPRCTTAWRRTWR